jgi:hypothetical protein
MLSEIIKNTRFLILTPKNGSLPSGSITKDYKYIGPSASLKFDPWAKIRGRQQVPSPGVVIGYLKELRIKTGEYPKRSNKQDPYCEWFPPLDRRGYLRNLSDRRFHNVCNLHSLQFGAKRQSERLYSHPREPFPEHLRGRRGRTGCNRCRYRRFLHYVTLMIGSLTEVFSVI